MPAIGLWRHDVALPASDPDQATLADWSAKQTEITGATKAAAAAHDKARVAEAEREQVSEYQSRIDAAQQDVSQAQDDQSSAQDDIDTIQPDVDFDQEQVDQAQSDYNEFRDIDTDGFWLHELQDARATLAKDQAPLNAAKAKLADAKHRQAVAERNIASSSSSMARASARADHDEYLVANALQADLHVTRLQNELAGAKTRWHEDRSAAIAHAKARYHTAAVCRSESAGGSGRRVAWC